MVFSFTWSSLYKLYFVLSSLQLRIVSTKGNEITAGNCPSANNLETNNITLFDCFTSVISHS